jgi:hypothetical protein
MQSDKPDFRSINAAIQTEIGQARHKKKTLVGEARADAERSFDAKSRPLVDVVIPVLEQAKADLTSDGISLEIISHVEFSGPDRGTPFVKFSIGSERGERLPNGVGAYAASSGWFVVEVAFLQGGVRFKHLEGKRETDITQTIGVRSAEGLTTRTVAELVRLALRNFHASK